PALKTAERYRDVTADKVLGDVAVGRVYQAEGRHDDAIAAFRRALEQDMNSGAALTGLVRSYIATDRSTDAMAYLKQLIGKAPDNVYAHNLLGEVYAFDKVSGKAEKSFLRATAIRGNWSLPYINLGRLMVAQNEPSRAVEILKKGLQEVPDDTTLQFGLASAHQAAREYDEAIDTYKAILQREPSFDAAANNIAAIIADRKFEDPKSLDDALSYAQRFQVSENPYYLDTLGWVHYRRGDYNLAVVFLKRAVDQLPEHPVLNYHLAMAYYKAGQREEARAHLEKAVAKEANYPEIDEARALLQSM
ncbi:MAG: tetratricopeptide repeat protein, partial [Alphaproteobacteria bacterium]|nr:tetratricopeptide repeat protein [Alphaproteobacteria bacterium]